VSFGIGAKFAAGRLGQVEIVQELSRSGLSFGFTQAVKRRAETQVVETGELRVQIALVRYHADYQTCLSQYPKVLGHGWL
jgi:hypothetical protein